MDRRAPVCQLSQDERAVIAILSDESFQPGDLVMFPDGLKVFQGASRGLDSGLIPDSCVDSANE
jgi:hypothetical protein